ncbi:XRE family transcriptional regulator [Lactiplantibacillus plantarum]|nr:XRE family transcriptional regulator [Lactiplantibacillus plantarum]
MARFSDNKKTSLGIRIKSIRQNLQLDQAEFGKKVIPSASASNVSRWERGLNVPSQERLQSIAKLGGVTTEFMLNGSKLSLEEINQFSDSISGKKSLNQQEKKKVNEINLTMQNSIDRAIDMETSFAKDAFKSSYFDKLTPEQRIFLSNILIYLKNYSSSKVDKRFLGDLSFFISGISLLMKRDITKEEFYDYEKTLNESIEEYF